MISDNPILVGAYLDIIGGLHSVLGSPPTCDLVETCLAYVMAVALTDHGVYTSEGEAFLVGNGSISMRGVKLMSMARTADPADQKDPVVSIVDGCVVLTDRGKLDRKGLTEHLPVSVKSLIVSACSMAEADGKEGIRVRTLNALKLSADKVGWLTVENIRDGLLGGEVH